jgi:hypothetical protein
VVETSQVQQLSGALVDITGRHDGVTVLGLVTRAYTTLLGTAATGTMLTDPRGGVDLVAVSDERALNLLCSEPTVLPGSQLQLAQALSDLAILRLSQEQDVRRSQHFAEHALTALNHRAHIAHAVGLLAGGLDIDVDEARRLLAAHAGDAPDHARSRTRPHLGAHRRGRVRGLAGSIALVPLRVRIVQPPCRPLEDGSHPGRLGVLAADARPVVQRFPRLCLTAVLPRLQGTDTLVDRGAPFQLGQQPARCELLRRAPERIRHGPHGPPRTTRAVGPRRPCGPGNVRTVGQETVNTLAVLGTRREGR